MGNRLPVVGLLGQYGVQNLGNEGSLESFLELGRKDANMIAICDGDALAVAAEHGCAAISMDAPPSRWLQRTPELWRRVVSKVMDLPYTFGLARRFDVIVVPGSGVLEQLGVGPWGVPLQIFRYALATRLCGRRFVLFGVGAEGNEVRANRWLMRNTVRMANYVSFRDHYSKNCMIKMGASVSDAPVHPDIAFLSAGCGQAEVVPDSVVVGVMAYYGVADNPVAGQSIHADYVEKLADFVHWLVTAGRGVQLVVGAATDFKVAQRIVEMVRIRIGEEDARKLTAVWSRDLAQLAAIMERAEVVVATRYHNVLVALKTCRPTISIGYAHKNAVLMQSAGLAEFCQEIETLDVTLLMRQFDDAQRRASELTSTVSDRTSKFDDEVRRQYMQMWAGVRPTSGRVAANRE